MAQFSPLDWFQSNIDLAQWFVVGILVISAILIIWQISEQTKSRKGSNFVKVIELLTDEKMLRSVEAIYNFSKYESKEKDSQGIPVFRGIEELKKSDHALPKDIKNAVIKIREIYHSVGVMLGTRLVDRIPFLMLQSSQARDMWELLVENIEKVREERMRNENDVPLWMGFEFLGKLTYYWSIISFGEKMFLTGYPIFIPMPDSSAYRFRIFLHENNLLKYIIKKIRQKKRK